jgi:hypothetical protein
MNKLFFPRLAHLPKRVFLTMKLGLWCYQELLLCQAQHQCQGVFLIN